MNSQKNFFIIVLFFSFFVSVFGSFLYEKYSFGSNFSLNPNISPIIQFSSGSTIGTIESDVKVIAKSVSPSVVSIIISKDVQVYKTDPFGFFYEPSGTVRQQVGGGSGFFISRDGYVITNKHVVSDSNATYSIITSDNREYVGKVVALDPGNDIAIIRAYDRTSRPISGTPAVRFVPGNSSPEVGTFVLAIGNALSEFQNTVTFGVISGLGRSIEANNLGDGESEQLTGLIQTDAAINPGNSGGPLVGIDGNVLAMNTAIAQGANGLGFAIPLSENDITYIRTSIEKYQTIKRSYIGIRSEFLDDATAKERNIPSGHGFLVASDSAGIGVAPGSPAEKAGIEIGDVIVESSGISLDTPSSLKDSIRQKFPGEKITLKVWKKKTGKVVAVDVVLGEL